MKENGKRSFQRLTQDTLILIDVIKSGRKSVKKIKLIKLNPAKLEWYNIQLAGPNRHSEFLYKIHPEGPKASRLDFTGLLVVYSKQKLPSSRIRKIASAERGYDSQAWKDLAKAMEKDLNASKRQV
jgi:hypothetical protein